MMIKSKNTHKVLKSSKLKQQNEDIPLKCSLLRLMLHYRKGIFFKEYKQVWVCNTKYLPRKGYTNNTNLTLKT